MSIIKTDVAVAAGRGIIGAVRSSQTWREHFTSRGWSTPRDQVDAGFPIYIQPALLTGGTSIWDPAVWDPSVWVAGVWEAGSTGGIYTEDWDYGSVVDQVRITASVTWTVVAGNPVLETDIGYKENSGDAWTTVGNTTQVMATNARYFQVTARFIAPTDVDLARLHKLDLRLDLKQRTDSGRVTANSADSGGTAVAFALAFKRITSITCTPHGTALRTAVVDFTDIADPTSFKILLFDAAGDRVTGDVSWEARGTL